MVSRSSSNVQPGWTDRFGAHRSCRCTGSGAAAVAGLGDHITLTQDDLDLIHRTVDTQIHGKPLGTSASWVNPNTGNAGTLKLLHKFKKGNLQCEKVAYTLTTKKNAVEPEHYVFNSCLTPEGWRIALYADEPFLLNTSIQVSQRSLYPVSSGPG